MIDVYSGSVGTGKSLHASRDIRYRLNRRNGGEVVANFALGDNANVKHPERYHYVPNSELSTQWLYDFAESYYSTHDFSEKGILLVLDEVQLWLNSRNWQAKDRLDLLEFLSQSRKWGYRIILIAQSMDMIDNQVRMLVEYEYNHRRLGNMGMVGALLALPFGNRLFMHVCYYVCHNHKERLGADLFLASKRDFRMYDTRAVFQKSISKRD